jgi:hypothetical protein
MSLPEQGFMLPVPNPVPGLNSDRLIRLMNEAIERCEINLSGRTVYTEAASGCYIVTPILAAMAGADAVTAITRKSRYATAEDVREATLALAQKAGVAGQVRVVFEKQELDLAAADIVTNSGFVRPLDKHSIGILKPSAVIPLMYEAWEFRDSDLDLPACRKKGIAVAGTNECHPQTDVFSFLGPLAVKLLNDAGISVLGNRLLLLCDNPFGPFIEHALTALGALVDRRERICCTPAEGSYDAVVVALHPKNSPVLTRAECEAISKNWHGMVICQFWGDLDRGWLEQAEVPVWPLSSPARGHMGILLSAIGPEPVVRLQAGGLKVGEILSRARLDAKASAEEAEKVAEESGWGQRLGSGSF